MRLNKIVRMHGVEIRYTPLPKNVFQRHINTLADPQSITIDPSEGRFHFTSSLTVLHV
jgi:hypothetical protein